MRPSVRQFKAIENGLWRISFAKGTCNFSNMVVNWSGRTWAGPLHYTEQKLQISQLEESTSDVSMVRVQCGFYNPLSYKRNAPTSEMVNNLHCGLLHVEVDHWFKPAFFKLWPPQVSFHKWILVFYFNQNQLVISCRCMDSAGQRAQSMGFVLIQWQAKEKSPNESGCKRFVWYRRL